MSDVFTSPRLMGLLLQALGVAMIAALSFTLLRTIRRVPLTPLAASEAPAQIEPPPTSGPSRQSARPPEAFRALIESLDFDNFGPRPGEDHSSGASNAA